MVNQDFSDLCSKAWAIQILAHLGDGNIARASPIAHALGASRTSVSASIAHLGALGYLARAGGHGHPLRAEYSLTDKGRVLASWAADLVANVAISEDQRLMRRAWTLPVLRLAAPGCHFAEFRSALSPVTDRALSQTLKAMSARKWLKRSVDDTASPPRVSYMPDGLGSRLAPVLQRSFSILA